MKKYISLFIALGLMAQFPQKLTANFFSIKPSAGISYGGKIMDRWSLTSDYFNFRPEDNIDKSATVNITFELVFSLFENFSISVGAGYISKGINGRTAVFSFPDTADPGGDFYSSPQFHFKSIFGLLSAQWTFPLSREANGYILGGIGYYSSQFNNYDKNIYYSSRYSDFSLYFFPIAFKARSNSIGYHGGAGAEVELDMNVFFFVEGLYRRVNFKDLIKSNGESGESPYQEYIDGILGEEKAESVFLFYRNTGPEAQWGDLFYSIDNILLSEIVIRIGMRISF